MKTLVSYIRKLCFGLFFFACLAGTAYGAPGPASAPFPSLTIGGRTMSDLSSSLITLVGTFSNTAGYATLRQANASAGYQVPTGKTLHLIAAQGASSVSGIFAVAFGYGTADAGLTSASAPTGWTGMGGTSGTNASSMVQIGGSGQFSGAIEVLVPATDYPAVVGSFSTAASAGVIAWGYLQ
jgi:hypothetical protein